MMTSEVNSVPLAMGTNQWRRNGSIRDDHHGLAAPRDDRRQFPRYRQEKVIQAFAADLTASQTALLLGLSRTSMNRYFGVVRANGVVPDTNRAT